MAHKAQLKGLMNRFIITFRERSSEWVSAIAMLFWGLLTFIASHSLFQEKEWFAPLLSIASQNVWAFLILLAGLIRVAFLIINGAWRPSAHIRALGSISGIILWSALLMASISLSFITPTTAVYAALLGLDILSLWFSAGDAKLADMQARGELEKL